MSLDMCIKHDQVVYTYITDTRNKHKYTNPHLKTIIQGLIKRKRCIAPIGGISKLRKYEMLAIVIPVMIDAINKIQAFMKKKLRPLLRKRYIEFTQESTDHHTDCVNQVDFYTLEPISNIPINQFFAFKEGSQYYGFNIFSLQTLFKYRNRVKNPFTNIYLSEDVVNLFEEVLKFTRILYPDIVDMNQVPLSTRSSVEEGLSSMDVVDQPPNFFENIYPIESTLSLLQREVLVQIKQRRELSIDRRIEEVFMEMDHLEYYTESVWFKELTAPLLNRLARNLRNYWDQESHLSPIDKANICCLGGNPFYGISLQQSHLFSLGKLREACVIAIENMVYTGVDVSNRKIGVLNFIIQLMKVSDGANRAFSWLY